MRKENRRTSRQNIDSGEKVILYTSIGVVFFIILVLGLLIYNFMANNQTEASPSFDDMLSISESNTVDITESASSQIGKTVAESEEELEETKIEPNQENIEKAEEIKIEAEKEEIETKEETIKQELEFQKPVEGEIIRGFAQDTLVYSQTLEEWVTHLGIDIAAPKTTVVNSAETGTIKTIKNDPRYGLTIVIEHIDGYQTVYSNLLSSEFVIQGEQVEKGQPIGTVGNTATFEILDEPHLHFEILKDSLQVDPNIYLK